MKKKDKHLEIMLETACAEYGSALEMLAACKLSNKSNFAYGYFHHSKDEYNHTKSFKKLLGKAGESIHPKIAKKYKFNSIYLINKGYVSEDGYLIETMKLKDFIAYVYTNELLAKDSFAKILDLFKTNTSDSKIISSIMEDELRHHGFSEKHFLKYYPRLQPWQLKFYRMRETLKNKTRKLYDKNIKFLDKVLTPVYFFMAYLAAKIVSIINLKEFQRKGNNLMEIRSKSIL